MKWAPARFRKLAGKTSGAGDRPKLDLASHPSLQPPGERAQLHTADSAKLTAIKRRLKGGTERTRCLTRRGSGSERRKKVERDSAARRLQPTAASSASSPASATPRPPHSRAQTPPLPPRPLLRPMEGKCATGACWRRRELLPSSCFEKALFVSLSLPLHFLILLFVLARHLGSCSSGEEKFPHRLRQMGGTKPCYPEGATNPSLCFHRTGVGITSAFLRQRLMATASRRAGAAARQCVNQASDRGRGRNSLELSRCCRRRHRGSDGREKPPLGEPSLPQSQAGDRWGDGGGSGGRAIGPGVERRLRPPLSPPSPGRFGGTSERATAVEQKVTLPRGRGCGAPALGDSPSSPGKAEALRRGDRRRSERATCFWDCCFSAG